MGCSSIDGDTSDISPKLLGLQELKPIMKPLNLSVLSKGLLFLKETEYVRGLKYN